MSTQKNDSPGPPPATPTKSLLTPPPFPVVPLPDFDARTQALRVFAQWLSSLEYRRTMAPGQPAQPFSLGEDRVFVEQPDNVEGLQFPCISMLPGRGQYLVRGLGGAEPDDETATVDGLALLVPYDYTEMVTVEGWGSKIAERRSLVAAIEVAMGSYEGTTDLRLVMPDYFGLVATFSLMERENLDDLEVPRGRRRVHLFVQMLVPVVVSARFLPLRPFVDLAVTELSLAALGEAQVIAGGAAGGGLAGLAAMGLSLRTARQVVRATLACTPAEVTSFSPEYLFAVCQTLAAQNASLRTWLGDPPPPGPLDPVQVAAGLPRFSLP